MRLPIEKIKASLLHPDHVVRWAAAGFFGRTYSPDPEIMPLIIRAYKCYGLDAFPVADFLPGIAQTEATVGWMIGEIESLGIGKDDRERHYVQTLLATLRNADAATLRPHESKFLSLWQFDARTRYAVAARIRACSLPTTSLWEKLVELCEELDQRDEFSHDDYDTACALTHAMSGFSEQFAERVMSVLRHRSDDEAGWLEEMAVRLTGEMRLELAAPLIVDRLASGCDEVEEALARIATDSVTAEIARQFAARDCYFREEAGWVLETIHSDLSVQTALALFADEQEEQVCSSLLTSALMNFATEAIEPARQFVRIMPKSIEVLDVRRALILSCKVMGETFPEFNAWFADLSNDAEFERRYFQSLALDSNPADSDKAEFDEGNGPGESRDGAASGGAKTVVIQMRPGQVFVKIADPKPAPDLTELLLRKTIDDWFGDRPSFVIDRTEAISKQGEMLGIHVWYHVTKDCPQPTDPPKPLPDTFTIEVHGPIVKIHSKEYMEAVLADAMKILGLYEHRKDTLLVVNPRRVAILLSKEARRGAIMPVELLEKIIDAAMKSRLQTWLASPPTAFYVTHSPGDWFAGRQAT